MVIDIPVMVMFGVDVDILVDADIIKATVGVIGFEFIGNATFSVDLLAGVSSGTIIVDCVPDIGTMANANSFTVVLTASELKVSLSLEKLFLSRWSPFISRPIAFLDCVRASLQTCKPSYHV